MVKHWIGTVFVVLALLCGGVAVMQVASKPEQQPPAEPRVIKIKEVIGQMVGGPQIVSGNPLIGYAVYIEETKTWGALHANGCPPNLGNGTRVVMYQRDSKPGGLGSAWYTFLRYE